MIWVMDSIPWVRCASGNVLSINAHAKIYALSLNHYLMSVVKSIILAPIHPKSASYNWCLRILQCSWERGEWGPGWRPAKKGQHGRRVFVDVIAVSSSNNKCLQNIQKMCWAGLTPVGRAAQAWPPLFSGSWGSSSTKPLMLYLYLRMYWIWFMVWFSGCHILL